MESESFCCFLLNTNSAFLSWILIALRALIARNRSISTAFDFNMSKDAPPAYGFVPPPSAPPSYAQAVGGVPPASPYTATVPQPTGPAIITTVVPVGPQTTHMICPSCHSEINTQTTTSPGLIAYVSGFLIALFGCWLGCCLIPCCIDECMDVHHTCPNCKAYLGRHRR